MLENLPHKVVTNWTRSWSWTKEEQGVVVIVVLTKSRRPAREASARSGRVDLFFVPIMWFWAARPSRPETSPRWSGSAGTTAAQL